jgi:hypothetical protein
VPDRLIRRTHRDDECVTPGAVEVLVRPAMREVWRPFYPAAAATGAAAAWAVVALARGAGDQASAALALVLVALVHAAGRAVLWRLRPGRVWVTCDDQAVHFRRGARVVRSCPWADVRRIEVSAHRWPEWHRWASFATVSCVTGSWPHHGVVHSPELLLVRLDQVARAQTAVDAAVRRYAPQGADR